MRSISPVTVGALNTFVEELGYCENDVNRYFDDTAVRLQMMKSTDGPGVETVMKNREETVDQEEFQLQLAKECFENGITYWTDAEYDVAMSEFQRSLEIREDVNGRLDEDTAKTYMWIGTIFWHKADYENALDNFSRSFRIKLELTGSKKHRPGIVSNWINKVLEVKGIEDKDAYWKKLLSSIEHERNGDELRFDGNFSQAIQEYRTALQLEFSCRGLNSNSPSRPLADAADLHIKIARTYTKQASFGRAIIEYRTALSVYMAKFGRHQRYTIQTYDSIADALDLMGYQDHVIGDYIEKLYEPIRREKTADNLMLQKDYAGVVTELQEALKVEESCMVGRLQAPAAIMYFKLARAHSKLGQEEPALVNYCKALGIFDSVLGSQHQYTSNTKKMIRALYI